MSIKRHPIVFGFASLIALTACQPSYNAKVDNVGGQFWQRISVTEATYQQGPKAQAMLERDIARCVTELRELERLGAVKNAIPTDGEGRTLTPPAQALYNANNPERDGTVYAQHSDYHDFAGCMEDKGWERVVHAPFDVVRTGRENYVQSRADYKPEKVKSTNNASPGDTKDRDFNDLNE